MPLEPRYTWEEDASSVVVQVTLPGGSLKHADVYVSDLVLKVNSAPYVLLLDLFDLVDASSVTVRKIVSTHVLHISLQKQSIGLWSQLLCEENKQIRKERREMSMMRKMESEAALAAARKDKKYQEEKQTLRAQMAVDDTNRQILQDLKAEEKEREERELYESFRQMQMQQQSNIESGRQNNRGNHNQQQKSAIASTKSGNKPKKTISFSPTVEEIDNQEDEEEIIELSADGSFDMSATSSVARSKTDALSFKEDDNESEDEEGDNETQQGNQEHLHTPTQSNDPAVNEITAELPPPRETLESEIDFTPRVFPTPSRESKAAEEEDWLLKNRKYLKNHKGLRHAAAAYDISESDPIWLKAKGDDFYRSRDYRGAVNAYTESISLASTAQHDLTITCLSNRAACLLQLLQFEECIADCSKALSLMPDTRDKDDNLLKHYRLKLKLFIRRGTAYCRIGKYSQAKTDYGVALSMDNQNPMLQDDFMQLLTMEKADELKSAGDTCFRENDLVQAIKKYSDSLTLNPLSIASLSNRAACYLACHEPQDCVADCTRALELLQRDINESKREQEQHGLAFCSMGPAAGSEKRREWVLKTLVRRGTAYMAICDWEKAEQDYAASVELNPLNEALKNDLEHIRQERRRVDNQVLHAQKSPYSGVEVR